MVSPESAKPGQLDTNGADPRNHYEHGEQHDEISPLLPNNRHEDGVDELPSGNTAVHQDDTAEPPMSTIRMILLSFSMIGLQLAWAAEMSNGSPFLLSLGLSKSLLAIVWIAGPLAGVLVQPIVGIWSDGCQISWGRRRPFLLAGAAGTVVSLLSLAWSKDIVQGISHFLGKDTDSEAVVKGTQAFAVMWIYILDFAVNVLQAASRAFIVDIAPSYQQDAANAWASRLIGFANICGYLLGYAKLPQTFPWLGNTQLKVLVAIGSACLVLTVSITVLTTPEKNPQLHSPSNIPTGRRIAAFLKTSFTAFSRLPDKTRRVCFTQLFNWIGWFPFLFYISTYIGQLYVNPIFEKNPNATKAEIDKAWEDGTRLGSFALLTFAITAFAGNTILPFLMQPLDPSRSPSSKFERAISWVRIPGLTIQRAWMLSHIFFAICMWSTLFIKTPAAGAVMTACVGLCWAMTAWAPFAIIATDISNRNRQIEHPKARNDNDREWSPQDSGAEDSPPQQRQEIDQAGVVLGMHNVSISAPQILSTLIASVIFHYTQKGPGVPNDDSIAQTLRFGGTTALVAAWATSKIS